MKKRNLLHSRRAWAAAAATGLFVVATGSAQTPPPGSYPSNQSYPSQTYPNPAYPNQNPQAYPSSSYPAQTYPGQQYPAQQYPTQQYPRQQAQPYPATAGYPGQTYPRQNDSSMRAQEAQATRASTFLGTDVLTSDERRLGDITDFVFDMGAPQRLAFVLVTSLSPFGSVAEVRALPADAVTIQGDTARIALTRDQALALAPLSGDPLAFLSDQQNLARLEQAFRQAGRGIANPGSAPVQPIQFTVLKGREVHANQGERLGAVSDVWINVQRDRAPYVEIQQGDPAPGSAHERVAIPLTRLQSDRQQDNRLTFGISADEIRRAPVVSAAQGIEFANAGTGEGRVLRISIPRVASIQDSGAGRPTGFDSTQHASTPEAREAARKIRLALDQDPTFRNAPVQVLPVEEKVRLNGTVTTDQLRDQLLERAEQHAGGVLIDNQLEIPSESNR